MNICLVDKSESVELSPHDARKIREVLLERADEAETEGFQLEYKRLADKFTSVLDRRSHRLWEKTALG